MSARVLITDFPWDDLSVEREVLGAAGLELVPGASKAGAAGEIERLARDANPAAILTCWARVSADAIGAAPELKIIARLGVGLDNIATEEAARRGLWVTNVPDYCTEEVADHALALLLSHFRGVSKLDRDVKAKGWHNPRIELRRVSQLCVALIGFGRIGRATAQRLSAFGCRVLAYSRSGKAGDGAVAATLAQIQAEADAIILQLPLTRENAGMVDEGFLRACKKRPLLVNVGRGGLVNNDALLAALEQGWIAGAALDVIDGEPDPPAHLMQRGDVVVTPHVAYLSVESLIELRRRACEDVVRVLKGARPLNICIEAA